MSDVVAQDNPSQPPRKAAGFSYAPGSQPLPGYVIKRGLGVGGFGEVYYAVSEAGKEVALKVVRRHLDVELRGVSQCLNLKHVNLVALYDVRVDAEDNHWIVMEYVAGERLSDVLAKHGQGLPVDTALAWFRGIAAGVEYLHQNGIVHRDLKPANLFRENEVVKIGDYGLSKFISASRRSGHTESVGTVHYMAPEIAGGRYGKEIDVYSLGVILCEMLCGRVPFDGESVGEILMKHLTGQPDLSMLAEPYKSAIAASLEKDPARRPETMSELVRLVDGGVPRVVAPPSPPAVVRAIVAGPAVVRTEAAATLPHPSAARPNWILTAAKWGFGSVAVFVALCLVFIYLRTTTSPPPELARVVLAPGMDDARVQPSETSEVTSHPAWSVGVLFTLTVLVGIAVSIWLMRRTIVGAGESAVAAHLSSAPATGPPSTCREVGIDVTGSWLLLFAPTAVVARLLLMLQRGELRLEQYVWTAATMFSASALFVLVEKWPAVAAQRRRGARIRAALIGVVTGAVSWSLADYLRAALPSEYQMTRFAAESWPECYVDGRLTWLAFVGYFGLTFFLVDWQASLEPHRRTVWRFSETAVAVFWACAVYFFFPFPQAWGVLIVAGCTLVLPLAFPPATGHARARRLLQRRNA